MLRLSTKGRYGLRATIELGKSFGGGPLMLEAIANRQGLSRKYLHALMSPLRAAGLVRSVRGARGGYELARPPAEIGLLEILSALEGPLAVVECVHDRGFCDRIDRCPSHNVWADLTRAMEDVLAARTLADLLDSHGGDADADGTQGPGC